MTAPATQNICGRISQRSDLAPCRLKPHGAEQAHVFEPWTKVFLELGAMRRSVQVAHELCGEAKAEVDQVQLGLKSVRAELERVTAERDEARREIERRGQAIADAMGRHRGMIDKYIPGSSVRSWPPGFRLKEEALQLARAALSGPEPVCKVCNDTHRMLLGERDVMCTHCPRPCRKCASDQGRGPYCANTPCSCECHVALSRRLSGGGQ